MEYKTFLIVFYIFSVYFNIVTSSKIESDGAFGIVLTEKRMVQAIPTISFNTKRDRVRALAMLVSEAYPAEDLIVPGNDDETKSRQNIRTTVIEPAVRQSNITSENKFLGKRSDWADMSQIGVQMVIYEHVIDDVVVLAFRGAYSDPDATMIGIWTSDFIMTQLSNVSQQRWVDMGNKESELSSRNGFLNMYLRLAFDAGFPGIKSGFLKDLTSATQIPENDINLQAYFAVAKKMVDSVIPTFRQQNKTILITGHSMGGVLGALISNWLAKRDGTLYETILFNPIGSRCVANSFNLPDEIDYKTDGSQITNYVDPYDIFPMMDYMYGSVCYIPHVQRAPSDCKDAMGKGIELLFGGGSEDFRKCRVYTHNMYHLHTQLQNDEILFEDGTTNVKCFTPHFPECPEKPAVGADYAFFIIFNIVIIIAVFVGIVLIIFAIIRTIYLKKTGKSGNIFWCCRCCQCCKVDGTI